MIFPALFVFDSEQNEILNIQIFCMVIEEENVQIFQILLKEDVRF